MTDHYFMDGHKMLWHLDKVQKVKNGERIAPIYLEVSPVSYCNHKCNFCGKDFVQSPDHLLKTSHFSNFVQFAGEHGLKSIMFAGEGEPLLHPDFSELVAVTKKSGIDVSLTTNGSRGHRELWHSIFPQLTWIRFSVNGASDEVYSKVHSTSLKEFSKVCKNIAEAVQVKKINNLKTTIGVQFVVLKENRHELHTLIKIFTDLGVDYITFKPFSRNPQMILDKVEVYDQEILNELYKIQEDAKINKSATQVICRVDAFDKYREGLITYPRCHALPYWAYMTASGDFYTCPIHIGNEKFKVGNINIDSAEKIIFGDKREDSVQYARNELDVKGVCRVNCRMARVNEFLEEISHEPEHVNFI